MQGMAIDLPKNVLYIAPVANKDDKSAARQQNPATGNFASHSEQLEKSAEQARQLAQLMRIQMTRNYLTRGKKHLEDFSG